MGMKILERELGTLTFSAGQTSTLQLPRNYAYRNLSLRFNCDLTWTETTAGVVRDSSPAQLIQSIQIRANGRDVIKNFDFAALHRLTQLRTGTRPEYTGPASTGAQTNFLAVVSALVQFEMYRAIKPIDTLLDSSGLSTLELIITWGNGADIMGGAYVGTVTVNSGTLRVGSVEAVGVPPGTRFMVNKEFAITHTITAVNTRLQIQVPVGNLYRAFLLTTESDAVNVNTILNQVTLQSGTEVFKLRNDLALQADNKVELGLETWPAGLYYLEFVKDGRLTEMLDTARLSSLEFILDVAIPGTTDILRIYPTEIIVPPA